VPGLHTETVAKGRGLVIGLGRQLKQAIQLIAHHQQKRLAELSLSTHLAVQLGVHRALRHIVPGLHTETVYKERGLVIGAGQQLQHA
jgi:hypothetical protein